MKCTTVHSMFAVVEIYFAVYCVAQILIAFACAGFILLSNGYSSFSFFFLFFLTYSEGNGVNSPPSLILLMILSKFFGDKLHSYHMATTASANFTLFSASSSTTSASSALHRITTVRCGSRDNRGPLLKGRILSTEAIQAIQALKRAYKADPTNLPTHQLSRLIKSDLTAALKELLRQDQCAVAAKVFSIIQSEYGADLNMYADMVLPLARNGLMAEIDSLIDEMEKEGRNVCEDSRGLLRLVKALIGVGGKESTVKIYGMMKRSGLGSTYEIDEYLGRVLSKGLRRFGEGKLADEVNLELGRLYKGIFVKSSV